MDYILKFLRYPLHPHLSPVVPWLIQNWYSLLSAGWGKKSRIFTFSVCSWEFAGVCRCVRSGCNTSFKDVIYQSVQHDAKALKVYAERATPKVAVCGRGCVFNKENKNWLDFGKI